MSDKKHTILNWLNDNWFKLVIVILFIILIYVLQAGLSDINSNLSDIDISISHIRY